MLVSWLFLGNISFAQDKTADKPKSDETKPDEKKSDDSASKKTKIRKKQKSYHQGRRHQGRPVRMHRMVFRQQHSGPFRNQGSIFPAGAPADAVPFPAKR
jgi:hypothetical protein